MINKQAPERLDSSQDGHTLQVHSTFYTIQGEGPFAGTPAFFIRLAGCNLACPGCDTIYADTRTPMTPPQLADTAKTLAHAHEPLAVITGGEPFRQNIAPLVQALQERGFLVQVETNGTLPPSPNLPPCAIVCSPKAGRVNPALVDKVTAYKYVLQAGQVAEDGLPLNVLGDGVQPARPHEGYEGDIYLSPLDEQDHTRNAANRAAVVESCLRGGYIVNLQIHKILNLP